MKVKLKRIPPLPAAKIAAAIYGCISLIFVPFMLIGTIAGIASGVEGAGAAAGMGLFVLILIPIFYIVAGFVGTLIGCFIYNLAAGWIGGIELEFDQQESTA